MKRRQLIVLVPILAVIGFLAISFLLLGRGAAGGPNTSGQVESERPRTPEPIGDNAASKLAAAMIGAPATVDRGASVQEIAANLAPPTAEAAESDAVGGARAKGPDAIPSDSGPPPVPPSPERPKASTEAKLVEPPPEAQTQGPARQAPVTRDACDYGSLQIGGIGGSEIKVSNYVPALQLCSRADAPDQIAIRSMSIGGQSWLLLVNPEGLQTTIEKTACWTCKDTSDETLKETRLVRAVERAASLPGVAHRTFLQNAGLQRGYAQGDFVTGDLCPSSRPLDRRFFETLATTNKTTPIALSISGLWLRSHAVDFQWLQKLERAGVFDIVWVNHSYSHPYAPGQPFDHTFLMTQNLNLDFEILETERLLVSHGGTPSVFFRFPGLISSGALMETIRKYHLISLGAEAWLAKGERPRHGSIILVHPNGNEEVGLDTFDKLYKEGSLNTPLESIRIAP